MSYASIQATAVRILKEKGQPVVISRVTEATYDPSTSAAADGALVVVNASGVPFPVGHGLKLGNGTDIQVGDQQLLISPLDEDGAEVVVRLGDKVEFGGRGFSIVDASLFEPGGLPLLWDCIIRGGGA